MDLSWQTAINRKGPSVPCKLALSKGIIHSRNSILDYGCGKGADSRFLSEAGFDVQKYDPHHWPVAETHLEPADIVLLHYVLNTIADPLERRRVLERAWELTKVALVVAVRPHHELSKLKHPTPEGDGWRTNKGTFQRFYTRDQLVQDCFDSDCGASSFTVLAPSIIVLWR